MASHPLPSPTSSAAARPAIGSLSSNVGPPSKKKCRTVEHSLGNREEHGDDCDAAQTYPLLLAPEGAPIAATTTGPSAAGGQRSSDTASLGVQDWRQSEHPLSIRRLFAAAHALAGTPYGTSEAESHRPQRRRLVFPRGRMDHSGKANQEDEGDDEELNLLRSPPIIRNPVEQKGSYRQFSELPVVDRPTSSPPSSACSRDTLEGDVTWLQYHQAVDRDGKWSQSAIRRRLPRFNKPDCTPPYSRAASYRGGWLQEQHHQPSIIVTEPLEAQQPLTDADNGAGTKSSEPSPQLAEYSEADIRSSNLASTTPRNAGLPLDRDLGNKFAASPSEPDCYVLSVHSGTSPQPRKVSTDAASANPNRCGQEVSRMRMSGHSDEASSSGTAGRLFGHPWVTHRADNLDIPAAHDVELVASRNNPARSGITEDPPKSQSDFDWSKGMRAQAVRAKLHKFFGADIAKLEQSIDRAVSYTSQALQDIIAAYTRRTFAEDVEALDSLGGEYQLLQDLAVFPNDGLNDSERAGRRAAFGSNSLPRKKMTPFWRLLWEAGADPMLRILMVAAIVSIVLGVTFGEDPKIEWIEGAAIFLAICIVVIVTAANDYFKEKQFADLCAHEEKKCSAIRNDGQVERILADDLVVGDVLVLETGDEVPADALVIQCTDLKVDESSLTGEPDHIMKKPINECIRLTKEAHQAAPSSGRTSEYPPALPGSITPAVLAPPPPESRPPATHTPAQPSPLTAGGRGHHAIPSPVILSGTAITSGNGKAIVVAVGTHSQSGKLFTKLTLDTEPTPLQNKLNALARDVGRFGFIAALVTLVVLMVEYWIIYGLQDPADRPSGSAIAGNMVDYLVVAITIIVVAVPEGLPLAVTISLAFSVGRMLKDMNYVRKLAACETMGGATEICSDKTGTLTKNQMEVEAFWNGSVLATNLRMDIPAYEEPIPLLREAFLDIFAQNVAINATGYLERQEVELPEGISKQKKIITRQVGSPTECALLLFIQAVGYQYEKIRRIFSGTEQWSETGLKRKLPTMLPGENEYPIGGDPTDPKIFEQGSMIVHQVPFSSDRKIMTTITKHPARQGWLRVYTKGAAEIVLHRCVARVDSQGDVKELDATKLDHIETSIVHQLAQLALRTICLAYRDINPEEFLDWQESISSDVSPAVFIRAENGLTCLGICGIRDPLRDEVPAAVKKCQRAGINVRMCTGDNIETAKQIALKANIYTPEKDGIAMLGADFLALVKGVVCENCKTAECDCPTSLDQLAGSPKSASSRVNLLCRKPRRSVSASVMQGEPVPPPKVKSSVVRKDVLGDPAAFKEIADKLQVLARSQPSDKYALVTGLKNLGAVVAVTGDGTNDAPALKKADVGFAMGITGKEVAKQAADIVLLDDNFESIVRACKWGRNIYDNIQRFLQFQLTVNLVAVVTAFVGAVVLRSSPLNAVQLLWVNLIMDTFAALALATEMPTDKLLERQPQKRESYLVSKIMVRNMIIQATYQIAVMMAVVFSGECWLPEFYDSSLDDPRYPDFNQFSTCGTGHVHSGRRYFLFSHDEDYKESWAVEITPSRHYTYVFNIFVFMQAFNLLNARKIGAHEYAIFRGVLSNWYWIGVIVIILVGQALLVELGGIAVGCHVNGLTWQQWLICVAFGVGTWVAAFLGKLIPAGVVAILPQAGSKEVSPIDEPTSVALASRGRISSGRISHRMHIMNPDEMSRYRSQIVSSLRGSAYSVSSRAHSYRSPEQLDASAVAPEQSKILKAVSNVV